MAKGLHRGVWRHVQTLFNAGVIGDVTDEQLLERFATGQGEAAETAFAALVERHGPMVLRICRTVLHDRHDAEDAFQATFLVLARRAGSIRNRASVASWLHGVARRVASCARSAAARRREHERRTAEQARRYQDEPAWDDLAELLHEEIDQLPERYRTPLVLCDMEGLTEGQAARRLGRPVGTIRSQLTRARDRLRRQLAHRGLDPATALLVGAPIFPAEQSVVASSLADSTTRFAMDFAVARATTAGMVSASVTALAEEFLRSLLMARLKIMAMAVLVAIGIATAGAFALDHQGEKSPPAGDTRQELLDLMHVWAKALVQSDVATVDRLLAYEMFGTDPVGGLWNKSKYLEHVKVNAFRIESYEFKDFKVQAYGDAAVVTDMFLTNINSKRWPSGAQRSTSTWIRRHGSWQCVAWQTMVLAGDGRESDPRHATPLPAPISHPDPAPQGGAGVVPEPAPQPLRR